MFRRTSIHSRPRLRQHSSKSGINAGALVMVITRTSVFIKISHFSDLGHKAIFSRSGRISSDRNARPGLRRPGGGKRRETFDDPGISDDKLVCRVYRGDTLVDAYTDFSGVLGLAQN